MSHHNPQDGDRSDPSEGGCGDGLGDCDSAGGVLSPLYMSSGAGAVRDREPRSPRSPRSVSRETPARSTFQQARLPASTSVRKQSQTDEQAESSPGHFVDAAAMKERVRARIAKPKYDVSIYYKTKGVWPAIATDPNFEKATLLVIITNALWIYVDTDWNNSIILIQAPPVFQIAENFFCAFFGFEWFVRVMSFRRKLDGLRDQWFIFDGIMVIMMVAETWVFSIFMLYFSDENSSGDMKGSSLLKIARLLRLTRMCRMARLLRAMPELFVMIKGLVAAARSVFFTLVLLACLLFLFAIAFTQLTAKTTLGEIAFPNIYTSMYFLLVHGTLLLSADAKAKMIADHMGPFLEAFFFLFILLGAILLMNMLIGVLCEVVSAVAATEKEEMLVSYVGEKLTKVMALIDEDGGGTISRDEFMQILVNEEAIEALQDVGVDVIGLVDFVSFIFGDDSQTEEDAVEVELTLPEFMEVILQLRGSNNATVKDVVDLRKFVRTAIYQTSAHLDSIDATNEACNTRMRENMEMLQRIRLMSAALLAPYRTCSGQATHCALQPLQAAPIAGPSETGERVARQSAILAQVETDLKSLDPMPTGPNPIFAEVEADLKSLDTMPTEPGSLVADVQADLLKLDGGIMPMPLGDLGADGIGESAGMVFPETFMPTAPAAAAVPKTPKLRDDYPSRQENSFPYHEARLVHLTSVLSPSPLPTTIRGATLATLPRTASPSQLHGGTILEMVGASNSMEFNSFNEFEGEAASPPGDYQQQQTVTNGSVSLGHRQKQKSTA